MKLLIWIWLIFTIIFLGLSISHFIQSRKKVAKFQVTERPGSGSSQVKIQGLETDDPLRDFANDFNNYLDTYNKSTFLQNLHACIGYFAAAVIAFIAMLIELKLIRPLT